MLLIFLLILLYNQLQSFKIYQSNCKNGIKLYLSNLAIKKALLNIFNNDINKIEKFIFLFIKNVTKSIDKNSIAVLESQKKIIVDSLICNKLVKHLSKMQIENHKLFIQQLPIYKKKYILENYNEEVFYYHHGLRFSNEKILNYIYNKDIIDVGANIGDSLLVLQNYTNRKIHLYDISPKNIKKLKKNLRLNKINPDKYTIHMLGLSNFKWNITLSDGGGGGVGINKFRDSRNEITVNVNTLDNELNNTNCEIGFLKVDIEGEGVNFIKGAKNVIKLNRPVISIAIYHNYDEFFETRYFLENILSDYIYEYQQYNNCEPSACEINIFAYPNQLLSSWSTRCCIWTSPMAKTLWKISIRNMEMHQDTVYFNS